MNLENISEKAWQLLIDHTAMSGLKMVSPNSDSVEFRLQATTKALVGYIVTLETENAELRENADVVKYCGFEIITEEAHGKYPARKVLRGADGWTYVPGFPEVTK